MGHAVDAEARGIDQHQDAAAIVETARGERHAERLARAELRRRQIDRSFGVDDKRPSGKIERATAHVGQDDRGRAVRPAMGAGQLRKPRRRHDQRSVAFRKIVGRRLCAGCAVDGSPLSFVCHAWL